MKLLTTTLAIALLSLPAMAKEEAPAHPDTTGWTPLFAEDLSNAVKPDGIWTVANGELTASEDHVDMALEIIDHALAAVHETLGVG